MVSRTRADPFAAQRADLASLAEKARLRSLAPREGVDFASNDYLALAGSQRLKRAVEAAVARGVPVGAGGSRLLRGNHPEHEALEAEAAAFFGAEAALYFATGYGANSALVATLPQRGDLIVHDELIHASVHEGLRLARAEAIPATHNDPDAFEDAIRGWRMRGGTGRVWIAVESLYSMDGDFAPLRALAEIAERHEAVLVVDEAHATGVFGPDGKGLAAALRPAPNLITLHTCGKGLGCEGALLCGPKTMRDHLVNRARGFIFSTGPSPLMAAAVREAIRICGEEPERRDALQALILHGERVLEPLGAALGGSQIVPLIVGEDARAMEVARKVRAAGYDLRGIRPPTVPAGTARLRISLTLNASPADVDGLAAALSAAL